MGSAAPQSTPDAIERVWALIDKIPVSMLVTMDGDVHRGASDVALRRAAMKTRSIFLSISKAPKMTKSRTIQTSA